MSSDKNYTLKTSILFRIIFYVLNNLEKDDTLDHYRQFKIFYSG